MKEIVWVFGTSASGKETFIKHLVKTKDAQLLETLGWKDCKLVACPESIDYIRQYYDDPIGEKREKMLGSVPELAMSNNTVLIKWQFDDSIASRPMKLKQLLPDLNHKIILLEVDRNVLENRLINKKWWKGGSAKDFIDKELEDIGKYLNELNTKFGVTVVDSTFSENYKVTSVK